MFRIVFLATAIIFSLTGTSQSQEELLPCAVKRDDMARLSCYDGVVERISKERSQSTSSAGVATILARFKDLQGRVADVDGYAIIMGENVLLYQAIGALTALWVDIDRLSAMNRERVYEKCAGGCRATISGRIQRVHTQPGIVANGIIIR